MMKISNPLMLVVMLFSMCSVVNAQVFKWQDANGNWRYSDIPPINVHQVMQLNATKGGRPKPIIRGGDVKKANAHVSATGNNEPQLKDSAAIIVTEQNNREIKQQNCQAVKTHLAVLETGGRIRALNANGELAFLSDAELAQEKTNAQVDLKKYCD